MFVSITFLFLSRIIKLSTQYKNYQINTTTLTYTKITLISCLSAADLAEAFVFIQNEVNIEWTLCSVSI